MFTRLQIAPSELEDVLIAHPDVLEAAVTAVWDPARETEIPIGYVVLKQRVQDSEQGRILEDIQKDFNTKVSSYKRLRGGLHRVESLPKNATGKIMRNRLPARVAAKPRSSPAGPSPKL
jgi:4-coumarate--CoA ligase